MSCELQTATSSPPASVPLPLVSGAEPVFRLLGNAPSMQRLRSQIRRVALSDAPVAIVGESGSGKELAARDVHSHSGRAAGAFVAVNCGAIPDALMESEFFGHQRGAFTGAHVERDGFFQAAHGGTLFLDEVAELPATMQVKLLRAIQEGRVRKLGSAREEAVDVRIVSATHRDLAAEVASGRFRLDLFYRLQVIELRIPPLRERREDIPLLIQAFAQRPPRARRPIPELEAAALAGLMGYPFPGNVRELENILERALAVDEDGKLGLDDLPELGAQAASSSPSPLSSTPPLARAGSASVSGLANEVGPDLSLPLCLPDHLQRLERRLICEALARAKFHRGRAAQLLGISLRQIRYRMQRLGIHED